MGRKGFEDLVIVKVYMERKEYDDLANRVPAGSKLSAFVREIIAGYLGFKPGAEVVKGSVLATQRSREEKPAEILGYSYAKFTRPEHDLRCPCAICAKARAK